MSVRYLTLKRSDPKFKSHLWGEGLDYISLPVRTYNLGKQDEAVTFELIDQNDIKKPKLISFLTSLIKLPHFLMIVVPFFFVLMKNEAQNNLKDPLGLLLAGLSMFFLFAGMNIQNDILDHVSGFDRVNFGIESLSKPIRHGWISAHKAFKFSITLILIALVLALPLLLLINQILFLTLTAFALVLIGQFIKKNSYKEKPIGEFLLFLLMGPVLVTGFQFAAGSVLDLAVILFGAFWGLLIFFQVQANNFSHLMASSQAKIKNSMTRMGFDASKKFLKSCLVFNLVLWATYHGLYSETLMYVLFTAALGLISLPLYTKLGSINSPMGSGLVRIRNDVRNYFLGIVLLVVLSSSYSYFSQAIF